MKEKTPHYLYELPENYRLRKTINAMNKKTMLAFNAMAILVFIGTILLVWLVKGYTLELLFSPELPIVLIGFFVAILLYMVLHELVHGIFYKLFTREKLTFGISLACAWCGVPGIYVYRNPMLVACMAPFTVFTVIGILALSLLPLGPVSMAVALWFAIHVSGCVGDLYDTVFLLARCPKTTLVNDTGAKQTIFVPVSES